MTAPPPFQSLAPHAFAVAARALLDTPPPQGGVLAAALTGSAVELGRQDHVVNLEEAAHGLPLVCRAAGGPPTFAGAGVLALAWCVERQVEPARLINQACRPWLKLLRGLKVPVAFLGRDALSVPDAQVVQFMVTGTQRAYLLEARVAHHASLDVPGRPAFTAHKPGDRRPTVPLVNISRHVPADSQALLELLVDALGLRLAEVTVAPPAAEASVAPASWPTHGAGVMAPLGRVVSNGTAVAGPFFGSMGLTQAVERGRLAGLPAPEAVAAALGEPGAFVLGADAHHLVAALEQGRPP
jgi:lipoate-protein ligase A